MYSNATIIFNADGYRITSHGNGAAYEVERLADLASMFLQGDDASDFRDRFDACDETGPNTVANLCGEFSEVMEY